MPALRLISAIFRGCRCASPPLSVNHPTIDQRKLGANANIGIGRCGLRSYGFRRDMFPFPEIGRLNHFGHHPFRLVIAKRWRASTSSKALLATFFSSAVQGSYRMNGSGDSIGVPAAVSTALTARLIRNNSLFKVQTEQFTFRGY